MNKPGWLPDLVFAESYGGYNNHYLEIIYEYFKQDFIETKPVFRGISLKLKRYPLYKDKEATFWHIISSGEDEDDRNIDIKRCERIRWPKPIIEHSDENEIKVWENKRKSETRILIWFEEIEYLVILAKREGYILFWTSYPVTIFHNKQKLIKEYMAYKKANAAP